MNPSETNRRRFLQTCAAASAAFAGGNLLDNTMNQASAADDAFTDAAPNAGVIFKSVKWGMIGAGGSILEKFQLMKELGYDGIELNSPDSIDRDACLAASRETEMPIHGVVDSIHWNQRLSSPDEATRAAGLQGLLTALQDAHYYGGDTVLLVPGAVRGDDETHDDVWKRSIVEIRKSLPTASKLGVRILIENVWNGFCEQPAQLRDYIDEINSPWVGVYFDIGNVRKFGPSEEWIRALDSRIVKLDVKDWGQANGFCKIGDGDVDWAEVRKALAEIGYTGWATAEVGGGNQQRLAEIAANMNKTLGL